MARTAEHSARDLGSRKARERLPVRPRPYFAHVSDGLSIGYRRGQRGGTWIARTFDAEHGYRFKPLGTANDLAEDVGMSFQKAQDAARDWMSTLAHLDAGETVEGPSTVTQLMDDYLADRKRETRKDLSKTRSVINVHILPILGTVDVAKLTHSRVKQWRDSIAETAPRVRVKKGSAPATREIDTDDASIMRKRYATANRVFTVLRAALNFGYKRNRVTTKAAWERVTPFRQVDAPKVRYLEIEECKRLMTSCPDDFRALVRGALLTGCRYGELIALKVRAYHPESKTLHIAQSKSGKPRNVALNAEGAALFASLTDGRSPDDAMFTHWVGRHKGEAWESSQQRHWMETACEKAEITPAISFHILRHSYASHLAMSATPMPVIAAQLGHSDTRMTERHYAHLGSSYVADVVRANLPSFG